MVYSENGDMARNFVQLFLDLSFTGSGTQAMQIFNGMQNRRISTNDCLRSLLSKASLREQKSFAACPTQSIL